MFITLSEQEFCRCVEFSKASAMNQQRIEFGQADTTPRSNNEISRDNLIGKMAEVAFAKMLKEVFSIQTELDFNYYPRGMWDDQDAVVNGWKIDVKATRKGGRWMLIEWSKIDFRQRQGKLADLYAMAIVDWDRNHDLPSRRVELVGCASAMKLRRGVPTTLVLRKGETIPETTTHLQADNFAISFSDLEKDWESVIQYICKNPPPDLRQYPNPFTGHPLQENTEYSSKPVIELPRNPQKNETGSKETGVFARIKKWFRELWNIFR